MKFLVWGILAEDAAMSGNPTRIIKRCKDAGIGTYLAHVNPIALPDFPGSSESVWYNSKLFQAQVKDAFTLLLAAAKREGIEVEPWLLPFDVNLHISENASDVSTRTYQSGAPGGHKMDSKMLCASWSENRARAINMLHDLLDSHGSDISGIHLDMIRYTNSEFSLKLPCQCMACKAAYKEMFGTDKLSGDDLLNPGVMHKLLAFRCAKVRTLVEEVREITNRAGLRLTLAARADFFAWALPEGQDWVEWANDGLIDKVLPMNYFIDREIHRKYVALNSKLLKPRSPDFHYDGIGKKSSFGWLSAQNLVTLCNDAIEAGADGVSIFKYSGLEDEDFNVIKKLTGNGD